jgi:hypothetical protein
VRKGSKKSRSSPVKQPSQKTQADSGHQKERWTSGVASSRREDMPARSVISAKWYNCYKCYNCW